MRAKIFKPAKNVMQSGHANSEKWVLEYELETARRPEPLMGWVSSGDTLNQVRVKFDTKDEAVAFAQDKGFDFAVEEPHARKIAPRSYLDNFKYRPFAEEK